jgi:hypothetical protein
VSTGKQSLTFRREVEPPSSGTSSSEKVDFDCWALKIKTLTVKLLASRRVVSSSVIQFTCSRICFWHEIQKNTQICNTSTLSNLLHITAPDFLYSESVNDEIIPKNSERNLKYTIISKYSRNYVYHLLQPLKKSFTLRTILIKKEEFP